jgi:hypothetical protein
MTAPANRPMPPLAADVPEFGRLPMFRSVRSGAGLAPDATDAESANEFCAPALVVWVLGAAMGTVLFGLGILIGAVLA